jgi:hypothetical protein
MSTFTHTLETGKRDWRDALVCPKSLVAAEPQFIGYQYPNHPPGPLT